MSCYLAARGTASTLSTRPTRTTTSGTTRTATTTTRTAGTTITLATTATTLLLGSFFRSELLLVQPNLNTDDSPNGLSFSEAIVDRDTESLKRHFTFAILLGAGNVSTTKTTGATNTDAVSTEVKGGLHGPLHGAAERNTALKLSGHLRSNPGSVELGLADFVNVDLHLGTTAHLGDIVGHGLDLSSALTNDKSGA